VVTGLMSQSANPIQLKGEKMVQGLGESLGTSTICGTHWA
jgi:hypothetical protein